MIHRFTVGQMKASLDSAREVGGGGGAAPAQTGPGIETHIPPGDLYQQTQQLI